MPPNRLTDDELATLSTRLPEWTSDGTTLFREFRFHEFDLAEAMDELAGRVPGGPTPDA